MVQNRLAIVIPAYRAAETIERTVRSVFGQPGVHPHVIVVVDDEEGSTEAALASLASADLTVLTNPRNLGAQKSRNRGLETVDAEYVMFLDGDDFVMGDLLSGLVAAMADGADIAFGPWLHYDEAANRVARRQEHYSNAAELLRSWLVERRWTPPCAVLWRTAFLRDIGGWDESVRRNQDGEVVCRGALAGARLAASQRGCGVYVQHDSPFRITRSRSTFGDLIDIAERLCVQPSTVIGDAERRSIIGDYFCWLGDSAFRRGDKEEGRRAMQRGAQLGGRLRSASTAQKIGTAILGPETYHAALGRMRRR